MKSKKYLRKQKEYDTLKSEKEQPPTRWVDLYVKAEKPPTHFGQSYEGGFSMFNYLQNVKTNVSKANRKSPKDNKSLKSNLFWFFISSTSIP